MGGRNDKDGMSDVPPDWALEEMKALRKQASEHDFRFKVAQRTVRWYFEEHAIAPRVSHPYLPCCCCKVCQQAWKVLVNDPAATLLGEEVKPNDLQRIYLSIMADGR
jgi:hypothetical protein